MPENVGASTSRNPKGLHGLYRDNFTCTSSDFRQGEIHAAVGFGTLTEVDKKSPSFWDTTLSPLEASERSVGICRLRIQG
jgi:hypothetical protein